MQSQQPQPSITGIPLGGLTQATLFEMEPVKEFSRDEHNKRVRDIRLSNLAKRTEKIKERFDHKYNVERKRIDDVLQELADEFHLAKSTIESALKG